MNLLFEPNLENYFEKILKDIECRKETRAYIVGIFGNYKSSDLDLSKDSITLLFAQAKEKQDFYGFQKIGDWLFFCNIWAPNHLRFASKDYYNTIARLSYYSCYKLINRQWKLFEELSDRFLILEQEVKNKLRGIQ